MAAPGYSARVVTLQEYRHFLSSATAGIAMTPFQHPAWIEAWVEEIGRARACETFIIAAEEKISGDLVLLLPLVRRRHLGLQILSGLDLGVTDYNAPVLGSAAPLLPDASAALWRSLSAALPAADLLQLERVPAIIAGRTNPLGQLPFAHASRHFGNLVELQGTFDDYLRTNGRKFRKEYERYFRRAETLGRVRLQCAATPAAWSMTMRGMEEHQRARVQHAGKPYDLDKPEIARFYRRLLPQVSATTTNCLATDGHPQQALARTFALTLDGMPQAFMFGVLHDATFYPLRITHVSGEFDRCSPGRLILGETLRAFADLGIKRMDLSIGDYISKHIFSPKPYPLLDLHQALSPLGRVALGAMTARRRLAGVVRAARSGDDT